MEDNVIIPCASKIVIAAVCIYTIKSVKEVICTYLSGQEPTTDQQKVLSASQQVNPGQKISIKQPSV